MPAIEVKGSDVATMVAEQPGWQRGRGPITVRIYEGSKAAIDALRESLYTGSGGTLDSYRQYRQGGKQMLEVTSASFPSGSVGDEDNDAQTDATWELDAERLEKPLITNSAFSSITAVRAANIDAAIDTYTNVTESGGAITLTTPSGSVVTSGTAEYNYVSLRLRGVEAYYLFQYVIRRTWIVSKRSGLRAASSGVGQVDTPSIPSSALTNLSGIEWLKMAPDVREIGRNKFAISQEWVGAESWSSLLYGGSASP